MTTDTETINGHLYRVTRDDQGTIVEQVCIDPLPALPRRVLTKLEYRNLFTLAERIAIDNFAVNPALTDTQKATLASVHNDFSFADVIDLDNTFAIQGTELLEQYGLIAAGRAAQILATTL